MSTVFLWLCGCPQMVKKLRRSSGTSHTDKSKLSDCQNPEVSPPGCGEDLRPRPDTSMGYGVASK